MLHRGGALHGQGPAVSGAVLWAVFRTVRNWPPRGTEGSGLPVETGAASSPRRAGAPLQTRAARQTPLGDRPERRRTSAGHPLPPTAALICCWLNGCLSGYF